MDLKNVQDIALFCLIEEEIEEEEIRMNKRKRPQDVSEILKRRHTEGTFSVLICRHLLDNDEKFRQFFRLTPYLFHYVLRHIKEDLTKHSTNKYQQPVSPAHKFCIALRYLATGESFRSLSFQFRISHQYVGKIIKDVFKSINSKLLEKVIPTPTTEQFIISAEKFYSRWNYPNCIGAIDGKHIKIKCPKLSGSSYFNYKEFFSIVLLAIVDAEYKFIAIDVGSYGREGDAGIFLKSELGKKIREKKFNIPSPTALPGTDVVLPHVILGDEAFALQDNLMRSYPRKRALVDTSIAIYNYRHSRARRVVENAFGILSSYFRIFFSPIAVNPETVDNIAASACILYNILRDSKIPAPEQSNFGDTSSLIMPVNNIASIGHMAPSRSSSSVVNIRDDFKAYFNGPGAVQWQNDRTFS